MTSGSLLHTTTGRLLKALSDGGVDFYAVAAAVYLGKQIPIQSRHETEVSRLLNQRSGRAGYLAKALNIGWGHSDIAIELARTRAGTSALLTIGALATGSTIYAATQAFAELLSLGGCPPEEMPNIDVLKPMISYLAPFMSDLGFRKVFQHIITASKQRCSEAGIRSPVGLETTGEAGEWAKAFRQLVFTAQRQESFHLYISQRGAWLAAYASHILGMAVQVMMDELVLWQSAGPAGAVWIQLAHTGVKAGNKISCNDNFIIINPPTSQQGQQPMNFDYAIGEALNAEIIVDSRITRTISDSIERGIVRLAFTLKANLRMRSRNSLGYIDPNHKINGNFGDSVNAIHDQCTSLGISYDNFESGYATASARIKAWTGTSLQTHGLTYLDQRQAHELQVVCGAHGTNQNSLTKIPHCLCCRIGALIHGFGATVVALMQCVFDPSELRFQATVINSSKITPWSRAVIASEDGQVDGFATNTQLFVHLSQLLHGSEALKESETLDQLTGADILAVSIDSLTVHYRVLLDSEAFDDRGRMLAITSGRISHHGVLRRLVKESTAPDFVYREHSYSRRDETLGSFAMMVDGFVITPHYVKGAVEAAMQVSLAEDAFWVKTILKTTEKESAEQITISRCINNMLLYDVTGRCSHSRDGGHVVREKRAPIFVASFSSRSQRMSSRSSHEYAIILYALKDSTIEQLLQVGCLSLGGVLQGNSCLSCSIEYIQSRRGMDQGFVELIMS